MNSLEAAPPRRRVAFRVGSAVVAIGSVVAGLAIGFVRGLVPAPPYMDCTAPAGYAGGGYRCYMFGHPHLWLAVLVLVIGLATSAFLWFRADSMPWPKD